VIGVGVVGCGLIGRKRALALPDGMELRGCFDVDHERASAFMDRRAVASTATELFGRDDIELVVIATPHDALASNAIAALDAGKHVLVEKPGATTADDLREVAGAAGRNDRVARVGFNHRFHFAALAMREAVHAGRHGSLLFVRARYGHGGRLGYETEWRADRSRSGGGELIDQGSHLIDLTRWLFGDCELAFSELRTAFWKIDVEDNAFVALRPRSGGFAWLHASWTEWKNLFSFEVMLERAKLEISGLGGSYGPERLSIHEMQPALGPPPCFVQEWPPDDRSWEREMADVLKAIRGEQSMGATVDDAVATLELIEAAYA
jgi:predicted dehydrogenase